MQESVSQDRRRLQKTNTPGIYRRGGKYVVVFRNHGKQVKRFASTMAEARTLRAELTAVVNASFSSLL